MYPTCGWLMEQVQIKYAQLINEQKQKESNQTKLKRKFIVALKTVDQNETIDYWLTQHQRQLKALPNNLKLLAHYSKIIQNKQKSIGINEFQPLKVIGKGGFSRVYMVRKKDTGFVYAMKVLKKSYVTNYSKLKQIMNERTIMERLGEHPFIKEDLHFIIDFCTGGEMFYHLQQRGSFPEYMAKFYFAEIILGLNFLHSNNVVYRDLKPENVLIDVDGHIKLADFGLSKIFKADERSFSFCGSPEYMCPEILKREGHNHMVDYYTLGAILYEMLTGLPPYYTNNKNEMTRRILDAELTYPSNLNPEVVELMKGLLERNPNKRLGSKRGFDEIQEQEWCKDIDWNAILQKKITPPWKPRLDQSNFDPEYTSLPLNFDDQNFKRALQGDREFSFYYDSPCQSMTVTEHSIYASIHDLTFLTNSNNNGNTVNNEFLLKGGSSKKLIEHFKQQNEFSPNKLRNGLLQQQDRNSILISQINFDEIFQREKNNIIMNTETALKINETMIREESKISLEYNEESGLTNFRGFSFFGESYDEKEVKRQLIKYNKLRNLLHKKLSKIKQERGVILRTDLMNISLDSPNSSLSSINQNVTVILPTPPQFEDNPSRHSNPNNLTNNSAVTSKQQSLQHEQQSNRGSPTPLFTQIKRIAAGSALAMGKIDKKSKQQMIFAKLEESKYEKDLYKSFQPSFTQDNFKLVDQQNLFKSNIECPKFNQQQPLQDQHLLYLNESIKDLSSNEVSVAEERHEFEANVEKEDPSSIQSYKNNTPFENAYQIFNKSFQVEENKESPFEENSQDTSNQTSTVKGIKFILFQNQNVIKSKTKVDKNIKAQLKQNKIVVAHRNRNSKTHLAQKQIIQHNYTYQQNQPQNSSLANNNVSNTTTNSKIQFMINAATQHGQQNSYHSQMMASSREQQTPMNDMEQKSVSDKNEQQKAIYGYNVENVSTKMATDFQSIKSSQFKKTLETEGQTSSFQEYQHFKQNITEMQRDVQHQINQISLNNAQQQSPSHLKKQQMEERKAQIKKSVKKELKPALKKKLEIDVKSPNERSPQRQMQIDDKNERSKQESPVRIDIKSTYNFQLENSNQKLKQSPIMDRGANEQMKYKDISVKKVSLHLKQMSMDINYLKNEQDYTNSIIGRGSDLDKISENTIKTQQNVKTVKFINNFTSSQQSQTGSSPKIQISKLGTFGPSPKNQLQKNIVIEDETIDNMKQESDDEQELLNNKSQNKSNQQNLSKFNTISNTSKKDTFSRLSQKKVINQKAQVGLKKGTTGTSSTIGFAKIDTLSTNQFSKMTKLKPPINKQNEGNMAQMTTNKKGGGQHFTTQKQSNAGVFNTQSNTPSGQKNYTQTQFVGSKEGKTGISQALSQPNSSKNSQAQKFQFPSNTNQGFVETLLSQQRSPLNRFQKQNFLLTTTSKNKNQSSSQTNSNNISTIVKQQDDIQIGNKQGKDVIKKTNIVINIDSQEEKEINNMQKSQNFITIAKPPKTNKHSSNKGFFQ